MPRPLGLAVLVLAFALDVAGLVLLLAGSTVLGVALLTVGAVLGTGALLRA